MRVRRVAAAAAAAVLMAAKAAAAGGGGGRSSLFDRLSANAAAESEGARTRRLLATGTAAEPKKAATKKAETQLPSIPGVAKPKKQPPAIKVPNGATKGAGAASPITPVSPSSPSSPASSAGSPSPRTVRGKNAFAVAAAGGRMAAAGGVAGKRPAAKASSPRGVGLIRSSSMRDSTSPRATTPRSGGSFRGPRTSTVSAPVAPPHLGGVLHNVVTQVFPDTDQQLSVSLRLAHCGIYSAAELWCAISTVSDAHFYKIPKPFTYDRKARLVNELVVRSTAEQDIFSDQTLTAMMALLGGGDGGVTEGSLGTRILGEPKEEPAVETPMETPMHCALLCCDVLALRRKLMRIGIRTEEQFAAGAKGLESTSLVQLEINQQLKKVGERPVGKDTLSAILEYCKAGTEFAKQQVEDAEKKLRAELAPLKVGAVITRAVDVDGIESEKLAKAQETATKDEAAAKVAVVQMIVDKSKPSPCAVPMYGAAATTGKAASGSWLAVEASESASGLAAAVSSADCVWMKGELPIIIGLPHGGGADEPSLWELAAALRARFLSTCAKVPHIVVSTKSRTELDCSLQFGDLSSPSEDVSNAWKNYHTFIETAKSAIRDAAIAAGSVSKANDTAVFVELCPSQATEGSEAALNMCHIGYRIQPRMISKCVSIVDGDEGGQPVDKNDPEVKAQIESAFNLFDIDGSGDIDSSELAGVAKELVRLCVHLRLRSAYCQLRSAEPLTSTVAQAGVVRVPRLCPFRFLDVVGS